MTDSANNPGGANNPIQIEHNVRVVRIVTGEDIVCNFTQVMEEDKFVAYQCLYPLILSLNEADPDASGNPTYNVTYRRWNPYTPYEDHRINPQAVIEAMPPADDILKNYVGKLKDAGVDLSFLPNNGNDILGADNPNGQDINFTAGSVPPSAATEGPVATGTGGGN